MTYPEVVAELRGKFPKAVLAPSALGGGCRDRASGVDFKRGKGGMYAGRAADGTEVMVYYNDSAHLICCTELGQDARADSGE